MSKTNNEKQIAEKSPSQQTSNQVDSRATFKSLFEGKKYHEALECLEGDFKNKPKTLSFYNNRAHCLGKLDKNEQAIEAYNKVIENKPDHIEARYRKILCLLVLARFEEAMGCCKESLEIAPKNYDIWNIQGKCYYFWAKSLTQNSENEKLAYYEKALECFEKAIKIEPKNGDGHFGRVFMLMQLERHDQIEEEIDKDNAAEIGQKDYEGYFKLAIRYLPKNFNTLKHKGDFLLRKGYKDEAAEFYKLAHKLNPSDFLLNLNYGHSQLPNRPREAIYHFNQAAKLDPKSVSALLGIADSLAMNRFSDEAGPYYEQAISLRPNDAELYYMKAHYFMNKHLFIEARESYKKAIELDPEMAKRAVDNLIINYKQNFSHEGEYPSNKVIMLDEKEKKIFKEVFTELGHILEDTSSHHPAAEAADTDHKNEHKDAELAGLVDPNAEYTDSM